MITPKISINIPTYNDEEYISEALESILNQTFEDFELLIADDGSTDNTPRILAEYAKLDDRIRIITNPINLGRPKTFNKLIQESKADIIARMDADDISYLDRIEKQYNFMCKNKDISVCSCFFYTYETKMLVNRPCSNDSIKAHIPFTTTIVHTGSIYRKSHIVRSVGGYDERFPRVQDYNLWMRLSFDPKIKFANIPEPLVTYRVKPEKDEFRRGELKLTDVLADLTRVMAIKKLVPSFTQSEVKSHLNISNFNTNIHVEELDNIALWLKKLQSAIELSGYCNPKNFKFFINNLYKNYAESVYHYHLQKKAP